MLQAQINKRERAIKAIQETEQGINHLNKLLAREKDQRAKQEVTSVILKVQQKLERQQNKLAEIDRVLAIMQAAIEASSK